MRESIQDYPALRMEDDGFLLSVKQSFVDARETLFGACEGRMFCEIVDELIEGNAFFVDKGSSLPLYVPMFSDEGEMVGSRAVPVWSGVHVGFPLYPGLAKDDVERYIYGNPWQPGNLGEGFLECDAAFRLALLTHYVMENILIHELAAEAFLLGVYEEIPFFDEHYEETGLPSTMLAAVRFAMESSSRKTRMPDGSLCVAYGAPKTCGWTVRVRGSSPKERVLRDCWQNMRELNAQAGKECFELGGICYSRPNIGEAGRVRTRAGNAAVDFMVAWVDTLEVSGKLPKRGSRIDWIEIKRLLEKSCPELTNFWTADTMRRTYRRRKDCSTD